MILDEVTAMREDGTYDAKVVDCLKAIITQLVAGVEKKFHETQQTMIPCRLVVLTNHPAPIPVPPEDRRWFCLELATLLLEDAARRQRLIQTCVAEGERTALHLYHYFMRLELGDFEREAPPRTRWRANLEYAFQEPCAKWMQALVEDVTIVGAYTEHQLSSMWNEFKVRHYQQTIKITWPTVKARIASYCGVLSEFRQLHMNAVNKVEYRRCMRRERVWYEPYVVPAPAVVAPPGAPPGPPPAAPPPPPPGHGGAPPPPGDGGAPPPPGDGGAPPPGDGGAPPAPPGDGGAPPDSPRVPDTLPSFDIDDVSPSLLGDVGLSAATQSLSTPAVGSQATSCSSQNDAQSALASSSTSRPQKRPRMNASIEPGVSPSSPIEAPCDTPAPSHSQSDIGWAGDWASTDLSVRAKWCEWYSGPRSRKGRATGPQTGCVASLPPIQCASPTPCQACKTKYKTFKHYLVRKARA
jgi:hypothetical protein